MTNVSDSATSLTLLGRLRSNPDDIAAWDAFVDRYQPMIRRWCSQWQLQPADVDDVTQNVLLALSRQMKTFEYRASGRFRSWLKTIAYRAWCDFLEARRRQAVTGSEAVQQLLESAKAGEDFVKQIDDECNRALLEDAMGIVRQRVQTHTWKAFLMTAFDERSGKSVAEDLEMSILAVYRARSRVQEMIQEEFNRLDAEPSPSK